MCGIVGYVGNQQAVPIVLKGLEALESRGYDSAGVAVINPKDRGGMINTRKRVGKLSNLTEWVRHAPFNEHSIALGHNRWATHGVVSEKNTHPHVVDGVAVVHNGIIENHRELRVELEEKGLSFNSDTDTEVVPQLINMYLREGLIPLEAVLKTVNRLKGSFALGILFKDHDDFLIAVRKGSPLVIGFSDSGNAMIVSSSLAFSEDVNQIVHLEDDDVAIIRKGSFDTYNFAGKSVIRPIESLLVQNVSVGKGFYQHFMLKEIFEQPQTVGETIRSLSDPATHQIVLPKNCFSFGNTLPRLSLIGCGTSFHAGMIAEYWFKELAKIATECKIASEFLYDEMILTPGQAGIFISQSGETADTLATLHQLRSMDHPTLAITNVPTSTMSRNADSAIHTCAYPEVAVASTKAFTAQLAVLVSLAIGAGQKRGLLSARRLTDLISALDVLPTQIQAVLDQSQSFANIAEELTETETMFYIGRGTSYPMALEGALKMKEVSYIHAEGYPSGELKHGALALITKDIPVVAIAPMDKWFTKTASNIEEIVTRRGKIILFSDKIGSESLKDMVWKSVVLPTTDPILAPFLYAVAVQLLAYHTAVLKGTDVDHPRNLAKSVTVE